MFVLFKTKIPSGKEDNASSLSGTGCIPIGERTERSGQMIKAVVFDMDGIMFDTERQGQEAILAVGKDLGMPDIETFSVECLGATSASIAENFARR